MDFNELFENFIGKDWEYLKIDNWDSVRIYYKSLGEGKPPLDVKYGCDFYVLEHRGDDGSLGCGRIWSEQGKTEYEELMHGNITFDGCHHVHSADYFNYPDPRVMAKVWNSLHELEQKFCDLENIDCLNNKGRI